MQGDVIQIRDTNGNLVANYLYNAWGKVLKITDANGNTITSGVGYENPIRYRGYYYDNETGFYYLKSRYYDPETCRFISPDSTDVLTATPTDLTDKNLYAYCDNNPVKRSDDGGEFWNFVIGGVVGAVVGGVSAAINSYKENGKIDLASVAINATVGAVNGVIAASGLGVVAQAGLSALGAGAGNFAEQCVKKGINKVDFGEVAINASIGCVTSIIGSGIGKAVGGKINKVGTDLVNKGKDKLLTGVIRRYVGQSHSSLIRQGQKYIAKGIVKINTYRGLSSVIGTGVSGIVNFSYAKAWS